jgi:predicted nuclease of predicted toxin-antitoxin system
VKFLVDAQLPVRLAHFLNRAGHQAIHTSDLPNGNASTDAQVVEVADAESGVVITKDRDFRDGHLLSGSPRKLFIVATGNISNDALMKLFEVHLGAAMSALGEADLVELRAEFLVVHPRRDRGPEES